jgi:hypothetical protein
MSLADSKRLSRFRGQQIPDMSDEYIETVSIDILSCMKNSWRKFIKADISNINELKKCSGIFRE